MLVRNDDYWGEKAKLDRLIIRPIADNAARLQALQTGEIQGYDLVEPQDIPTIEGDDEPADPRPAGVQRRLRGDQPDEAADGQARGAAGGRLRPRPRRRSSTTSTAAAARWRRSSCRRRSWATPTTSPSTRTTRRSRSSCSRRPGCTLPVKIDFWYPTDVSRPYMPDPKRNFEAFAASLDKSGFKVTPHSAPWSPDYLGRGRRGQGRAPEPDRLDGRLRRPGQLHRHVLPDAAEQFGFTNAEHRSRHARQGRDRDRRGASARTLYQEANRHDHGLPAGRPVRAHRSRRSPSSADVDGLRAEPGRRSSRSRPSRSRRIGRH